MLVIEPTKGWELTHWSQINWSRVEATIRRLQGRIYRAAANVIAEYHLLRSRDCVSVVSDAMQYAADHPSEVLRDEMADQLVRQAELERILAGMPKTYRDVLLCRVTEGLSYEEIGKRLNFSPKTVEQYFFRAMTLVRRSKRDQHKAGMRNE